MIDISLRKPIHVFGSIVPLIYYFSSLDRKGAFLYLLPFFILVVGIDLIRLNYPRFNEWFIGNFRSSLREGEKKGLVSSSYFMIGVILPTLLFKKEIAIASMLFLTLGDTMAEIVGVNWGKRKIGRKSIEGSCGCFVVCALVGMLIFPNNLWCAVIGALIATLAELFTVSLNDALTMPLLSGLALTLIL